MYTTLPDKLYLLAYERDARGANLHLSVNLQNVHMNTAKASCKFEMLSFKRAQVMKVVTVRVSFSKFQVSKFYFVSQVYNVNNMRKTLACT